MTIKTAISIDDTLFAQVDALTKELNISRSHLFSLAVREYIERHENRRILAELNATYGEPTSDEDEARLLKGYVRLHRENLQRDDGT